MFWRTAASLTGCLALALFSACGGADRSGESGATTTSTSGGSSLGGGGAGGSRGSGGSGVVCSQALNQALEPIDKVSSGAVKTLSTEGMTTTIYVDGSAGGIEQEDHEPWIYLSLKTGAMVDVSDTDSLWSTAWDVGIKRVLIRTNGGDIGVGHGGAAFLKNDSFNDVTDASAARTESEHWFNATCELQVDESDVPETTFSGWYDYDAQSQMLLPRSGTFIVRAADEKLYKLMILDYYATPDGGSMPSGGGFFKLEIAPLR